MTGTGSLRERGFSLQRSTPASQKKEPRENLQEREFVTHPMTRKDKIMSRAGELPLLGGL